MSMVKITGLIRGLFAGNYPEADEDKQIILNNRGDQCVAQSMPELTELVRLGGSWIAASATAFAGLTTEPTTVAGVTIFNNEPDSGTCYAIDSVGFWERVTDATQQDYGAVFAMLNVRGGTAPTGGTAIANNTIRSLSGRVPGGNNCVARSGGTVVNDGWVPVGNPTAFATAFAGALWRTVDIPLRGLYLVPPKSAFSIQMVKVAAAASQLQGFIRYHEIQLIYKT